MKTEREIELVLVEWLRKHGCYLGDNWPNGDAVILTGAWYGKMEGGPSSKRGRYDRFCLEDKFNVRELAKHLAEELK